MLTHERNTKKWLLALFISGWVFFFIPCVQAEVSKIENVTAIANTQNILIQWTKPLLQETEGIIVLRKKAECPKDDFDGINLYRGNGSSFIDKSAGKGIFYCYSAYVYDSSGAISPIKTSGLVKVMTIGEYAQLMMKDNIFIGIGIILIAILIGLNIWKRKKYI